MSSHCTARKPCRVDIESLDTLTALWRNPSAGIQWTCPFILPPWLDAWWTTASPNAQPMLLTAWEGETVIGAAPWMLREGTIIFMGDPEVCDYFDFAAVPGKEDLCLQTLLDHLSDRGFRELELGPLAPEAAIRRALDRAELPCRLEWHSAPEDVYSRLKLPGSWEGFLEEIGGKQRHELQRKLRRLHGAGPVRLRRVDKASELPSACDDFLRLFAMSRTDKAAFMTEGMSTFFRALMRSLAEYDLLRLFFLDLDDKPVASAFCFDHQRTRYLYNSAYDGTYRDLGVGLMTKALSLKAAIADGLDEYNFLKGREVYKTRLGGKEETLSRCRLTLP